MPETNKNKMTNRERQELTERIKAMSPEELEVVIDILPVELCMKKITDQLAEAKVVKKNLLAMVSCLDDLK